MIFLCILHRLAEHSAPIYNKMNYYNYIMSMGASPIDSVSVFSSSSEVALRGSYSPNISNIVSSTSLSSSSSDSNSLSFSSVRYCISVLSVLGVVMMIFVLFSGRLQHPTHYECHHHYYPQHYISTIGRKRLVLAH